MEMADFWLVDKPAIHKLFKVGLQNMNAMRESKFQVLVPRLKDEPHAYTRYFNAPMQVKHLLQIGLELILISGECWYHTWWSCWSRKLRGCRSQV